MERKIKVRFSSGGQMAPDVEEIIVLDTVIGGG